MKRANFFNGTLFYSFTYLINVRVNFMEVLKNTKSFITVLELRRLITELRDKRRDICFRFRLIGEMWKPNFLRIIDITEHGLVVNDEFENKLFFLKGFTLIMQFEIDARFQGFEPHFHYDVVPDIEINFKPRS